jgi:hypothetical protein
MPFTYAAAPVGGALRQGEILGPLWDHEADYPPVDLANVKQVGVRSTPYDLRVVLSPDCDLLWDFESRFEIPEGGEPEASFDEHPDAVTRVLVCNLYSHSEMRPRFKGKREIWTRILKNQDERFHHLQAARVGSSDLYLHDLFLDFKRVSTVSTSALYEGLLLREVRRIAHIPDVHIHDLIHRFYSFLSRVAVP